MTTVATSGAHSVGDATSTVWSGSLGGSVVYNYDNQLQVSSIDVRGLGGTANGFAAQYARDDDDLVTSIASLGGGSLPALTLTRSPLDGHLVASTQGVVSTEYAMDIHAATPGYGELQGISHKVNGSELYGVSYQRDSLGRIEQIDETIEGQNRTRKYTYDNVGRLHMVLDENDALIHRYDYDGNGARIREESGAGRIALGKNLGRCLQAADGERQPPPHGGQTHVHAEMQTGVQLVNGGQDALAAECGPRASDATFRPASRRGLPRTPGRSAARTGFDLRREL
jgi:hypothetical protein